MLTVAGYDVAEGTITVPRTGAWFADLVLAIGSAAQESSPPIGAVSIETDDGDFAMRGTVAFGGVWQGHVMLRIEGGGNGMNRTLSSRFYRAPNLRTLLNDLCRESGETLDSSLDSALLAASVPAWTRRKATTASCLADMVRFLCPAGTIWRVLANGNLWIGTDAFSTTVTIPQDDFQLVGFDPAELRCEITTEVPPAALVPGVLFAFSPDVDPGRVSQIEITLDPGTMQVVLWFDDAAFGDRVWSPFARSMGHVLAASRFLQTYTGKVTTPSYQVGGVGPWVVDVQIDDPTATVAQGGQPGIAGAPRMPPLEAVPLRSFGPNVHLHVTAGARVVVMFEDGSPARPVVIGFEATDNLLRCDIGAAAQFVALANLVATELATIRNWANSHTHVATGGTTNTGLPLLGAAGSVAATKLKTE